MMIAAEKLIASQSLANYNSEDIVSFTEMNWFLPSTGDMFDKMSGTERIERFALVPLATIGPMLELDALQQDRPNVVWVGDWYKNAVKNTLAVIGNNHDKKLCLKSITDNVEITPCRSSQLMCPMHFVADVLRKDITRPDFEYDKGYYKNPKIKAAFAEAKINLSVMNEFEDAKVVQRYKESYTYKFLDVFGIYESLI